jgi:hypothetical protein
MKEEYKEDMPSLPRIMYGVMALVGVLLLGVLITLGSNKNTHQKVIQSNVTFLENSDSLELID